MAGRPRVLVALKLPEAGVSLIGERFCAEMVGDEPAQIFLRRQVSGAAGIVTDAAIHVDAALLDAAGDTLKVVANFGVGYDNIDLEAARARGVRVTNTPDVLTSSTAELAVALMLAAGRRIAEADVVVRRGEWRRTDIPVLLGRDLVGATVGLIGFGRIGQRVAELLRGFDVELLVHSRQPQRLRGRFGVQPATLSELLRSAEFVSLHVPLTPQTRHLIDARRLALMKPGAILVNTSRGAVLDTAALIEALRSGPIAAAGLDVYEDEPAVPAELRELRNTVLLPHIGSATAATRDAMARLCAQNLTAVIDGREPPTPVV